MASDIQTLNGTLQKVTADPSFSREAGIIPFGKERTRIVFGGEMNDKRICVATLNLFTSNNFFYHLVRKVIEIVTFYSFVNLKVNDKQTALASVRSLSSRLHLTRKQIFKKAAKGTLEKFILEKRKQISKKIIKKKAEHFFQKAAKNYTVEDGCLIAKLNSEISYDYQTIRKVYRSIFLRSVDEGTHKLEGEFEENQYYFKLKRKKLELLDYAGNEELAEGGSSQVYKVFNIARGVYNVIKCPKEDLIEKILNEGRITRRLNPNNDIPGLSEKAICMFNDRPSVAYKHYYNDLFNLTNVDEYESSPWFEVELEEQIFMVFQLVCGFYFLDRMGYCQIDYKSENIVWDKEGAKLCFIDFESLFTLAEMSTEERHSNLPFEKKNSKPDIISSSRTFSFEDLKYFGDAIEENNDRAFRKMLQKSSVFALGAALCEVLVHLPYESKDSFFCSIPDLSTLNFEDFLELGIPESLVDLFSKMLSQDPYKRPTAEELPDLYLNAISKCESEKMKPFIPKMEEMFQYTKNKIQERQTENKK